MIPGDTLLERRIAQALNERADSIPPSVLERRGPRSSPPGPPRWRGALVAAAVVGVLVVTVAVTRPFAGRARPAAPVTTTTTAPAPPPTTLPADPVGVVGPNVLLQLADTTDTQFLIRLEKRRNPAGTAFSVQIPGAAPIVVSGACMTIAVAPPSGTGYQGSCTTDPATRLVGSIDTGANETPTSRTYGAWLAVPDGATYVTFTYGDEHAWQRPVDRTSYFTLPASPTRGGEPVVLRAYDGAGLQLGEARAQPIRDGQGTWSWR